MAIRVIVRDVHHVRVFISRHVLTIRAVSIVERVKTRAASVPRDLAQACKAVLPSPGNMVSHVQAIVLVPIIIREKKVATSPVSKVIVHVLSMVSRARESKAVTSLVKVVTNPVAISHVRAVTNPVVVISPVAAINSVLSMVSRVRANRAVISPVAAISLASRVVISPVVAISLASRAVISPVVAISLSAVALRSNVATMIPMPSIL